MKENELKQILCRLLLISLTAIFAFAQAFAQAGYGTTDLALGKPITPLTSTVMGAPGNVTNGKIDDAWYSYYPGPTNAFTIDLGAEYAIGKLGVYSTQTANFKIWSSTDGVVWTERHSYDWTADTGYTTPNLSAPVTIHPDGAYSARFFKYQGWAYWNQYVGIVEFEVYEWLSSAPPEPSLSGLTNLALGQPALPGYSYPSVVGHGPEFLTDGNTGTYWQGNYIFDNCTFLYIGGCGYWFNIYGWAVVDLGSTQPVQAIRLTFPSNAAGSQTHLVSLANSGSNWTPYQWAAFGGDPSMVATNPALTSSTTRTFFLPAPVNSRYVWINIVNWVTPGSPPPGLAEVEVFGEVPSPSPTPTPSPTPPDLDTTQTSITCPASVVFDGSTQEPCSATVTGPNGFIQSVPVVYSNNTNAGTAAADATFPGDANHLGSTAVQVMFAITPAPSSTIVTCGTGPFVFNGSSQTPCTVSVTGTGGLALSPLASYSNNVNAGTATASYAFLGDANHFPSSDSKFFEISRAPTVTSIVCSNVPYNGSPQTPCNATVSGPGGLSMLLSITYANNTLFGPAAASANYPGAPNYEPSSASVTFLILANVPLNKDQCKNGGWQFLTRADGSLFTNQGDCIQYFNTGK